MVGYTITGMDLQNTVVTGRVVDKVLIPQSVQIGSKLQNGQTAIMPIDCYIVLSETNGSIHYVPPIMLSSAKPPQKTSLIP